MFQVLEPADGSGYGADFVTGQVQSPQDALDKVELFGKLFKVAVRQLTNSCLACILNVGFDRVTHQILTKWAQATCERKATSPRLFTTATDQWCLRFFEFMRVLLSQKVLVTVGSYVSHDVRGRTNEAC